MSLWKWNDVELEIDMEDVDFQIRYENSFKQLEEAEKKLKAVGTASEFSIGYCEMFFHLFDGIFGDGTSEKLFKGKRNLGQIDECYESFLDVCRKDVAEINRKRNKRIAKYMPKRK